MVVELELELIRNREREWSLSLSLSMLQELLELQEEVVEEFHSMVLDSLGSCCLELDSLEMGSLELDSLELDCLELGSPELDSLELECEAPEALEVLLLGSVVQLLSCCVRRLDAIVQVGTGRALLGRQQMGRD